MAKKQTYAPTLGKLAHAIDRTRPTLTRYQERGAPVKKTKKGYAVEPVLEWMRVNVRRKTDETTPGNAGNGSGPKTREEKARLAYLEAQAVEKKAAGELREMKLQVQRGEFIPVEEVKRRDIERISVVRSGLLSLPRRLAQELVGLTANQMEVMLRTRFREILERFSRM